MDAISVLLAKYPERPHAICANTMGMVVIITIVLFC